jgi:hypothetical protein
MKVSDDELRAAGGATQDGCPCAAIAAAHAATHDAASSSEASPPAPAPARHVRCPLRAARGFACEADVRAAAEQAERALRGGGTEDCDARAPAPRCAADAAEDEDERDFRFASLVPLPRRAPPPLPAHGAAWRAVLRIPPPGPLPCAPLRGPTPEERVAAEALSRAAEAAHAARAEAAHAARAEARRRAAAATG